MAKKRTSKIPTKVKLNTETQTGTYRPNKINPFVWWFNRDSMPFTLGMVDLMLQDDQVWYALNVANSPFQSLEVKVSGPDEQVNQFVADQWQKIWSVYHPQLMKAKNYGYAGYENIFAQSSKGLWEFSRLKDFHPRDIFPLLFPEGHPKQGQRAGMRVKHIEADNTGVVNVLGVNHLWITFDAEYGSNYGKSCLLRAYDPWKSKRLDGGAMQLIKQYFFKHSFVGMKVRYPEGKTFRTPEGQIVSGRDLAREMTELSSFGTCFAIPSNRDAKGDLEFDIENPAAIQGNTQLIEWIEDLNWQIFRGVVIPKEVVSGEGTSGAGYSGRSFPMFIFLQARDVEASVYVREINQQIIQPLVVVNFGGARADYDIEPVSLLETVAKQIGDTPDHGEIGDGGGSDPGSDKNPFESNADSSNYDSDGGQPGDTHQFAIASGNDKQGKWITIGAKTGDDGKKHGGVPVKVDGKGRITAGPKKFVGRSIKKLKSDLTPGHSDEKDNPRKPQKLRKDGTERSEKTGTKEQYLHNLHQAAKRYRVPKADVHEMAQSLWVEQKHAIEEREKAKDRVRELSRLSQRDIQRLENSGRDHTAVKGFDAMARQVAGEHPELGIGRGYESGGVDDTDYASKVWDVLREGKRLAPPKHDERLLDQAAKIVRENKEWEKKYGSGDDLPFALQFAAEHAPEGGVTIGGTFYKGGEFMPAAVIADMSPDEKWKLNSRWGGKKQKHLWSDKLPGEPDAPDAPDGDDEKPLTPEEQAANEKQAKLEYREHLHGEAVKKFDTWLDDPARAIPKKKKEAYRKATHQVLAHMNTKCLERLHNHTLAVQYHPTLASLRKEYNRTAKKKSRVSNVGGFWRHYIGQPKGSLVLDGGGDTNEKLTVSKETYPLTAREIYAHEMTHAIDGGTYEFGSSREWTDIWENEIKGKGVSEYAWTKNTEGFAEFGRLVFTQPKYAREFFPQAWNYWKSKGLVD